jgi:hypothetical protein
LPITTRNRVTKVVCTVVVVHAVEFIAAHAGSVGTDIDLSADGAIITWHAVQWIVGATAAWVADVLRAVISVVTDSFVDLAVAVVVFAVADLKVSWIFLIVERSTVLFIKDLIVVVVWIAGITHRVAVVVLLQWIEVNLAVVVGINDAVVVVVVVQAVGHRVAISVREGVVGDAVAVIVQAVTGLLGCPVTDTDYRAIFTDRHTITGPDLVGYWACNTAGGKVVGDAVTVFIHPIAELLQWRICVALCESVCGAKPNAFARAELVLHETIRGSLELNGSLRAVTVTLFRNALFGC